MTCGESPRSPTTPHATSLTRTLTRVAPRARYPWEEIEAWYITGIDPHQPDAPRDFPTHPMIVERYGMGAQYIKERAARDKWSDRRKKYELELQRAHREARSREFLRRMEKVDDKSMGIARTGLRYVRERLDAENVKTEDLPRLALAAYRFRTLAAAAAGMESARSTEFADTLRGESVQGGGDVLVVLEREREVAVRIERQARSHLADAIEVPSQEVDPDDVRLIAELVAVNSGGRPDPETETNE